VIVDVHAHYFPPAYFEHIERPLVVPPSAVLGHQSLSERLELLDRTGIDLQVLSIGQAQPYLASPEGACDAARMLNDALAELCTAHPRRFRAFASLPLPHVEESLREIERAAHIDAVVGYTLGCSVADRPLDDEIFAPVFEELGRRQSCVLLHPIGRAPAGGPSGAAPGAHNLTWLVGAPMEDTEAALRLVLSGVTERHPGLRIIVPHLGGSIPFLLDRLARVSRRPTMVQDIRALYFDTVSGSRPSLRCACETVGSDRLLFGTDYPYCDPAEFDAHLSYLSDVGLAEDDVRRIAGQRAVELLGLGAPDR
jgi:6-methylsalicylate decarboxylase